MPPKKKLKTTSPKKRKEPELLNDKNAADHVNPKSKIIKLKNPLSKAKISKYTGVSNQTDNSDPPSTSNANATDTLELGASMKNNDLAHSKATACQISTAKYIDSSKELTISKDVSRRASEVVDRIMRLIDSDQSDDENVLTDGGNLVQDIAPKNMPYLRLSPTKSPDKLKSWSDVEKSLQLSEDSKASETTNDHSKIVKLTQTKHTTVISSDTINDSVKTNNQNENNLSIKTSNTISEGKQSVFKTVAKKSTSRLKKGIVSPLKDQYPTTNDSGYPQEKTKICKLEGKLNITICEPLRIVEQILSKVNDIDLNMSSNMNDKPTSNKKRGQSLERGQVELETNSSTAETKQSPALILPRKRGRPLKNVSKLFTTSASEVEKIDPDSKDSPAVSLPKICGRPTTNNGKVLPSSESENVTDGIHSNLTEANIKIEIDPELKDSLIKEIDQTTVPTLPKKRGRPPKSKAEVTPSNGSDNVADEVQSISSKENTKIEIDPELKDSLIKEIDQATVATIPKKRGRPPKSKAEVTLSNGSDNVADEVQSTSSKENVKMEIDPELKNSLLNHINNATTKNVKVENNVNLDSDTKTTETSKEKVADELVASKKSKPNSSQKINKNGFPPLDKPTSYPSLGEGPSPVPKTGKMFMGAHVSAASGIHNVFINAETINAKSFAMFTHNQRQWNVKPFEEKHLKEFHVLGKDYPRHLILPHGSYLMNLCSCKPELLQKSRDLFVEELSRCQTLNIPHFNFHPGSCTGGESREKCCQLIAESINLAHDQVPGIIAVLENMCKQGNTIGGDFHELRLIISLVKDKTRVGVCLDTCHAHNAGYDLGSEEGFNKMIQDFDTIIGFQFLRGLHINDSKNVAGAHVDRHENIGKGHIGIEGMRRVLNCKHFTDLPLILETPWTDDPGYAREIKMLENLVVEEILNVGKKSADEVLKEEENSADEVIKEEENSADVIVQEDKNSADGVIKGGGNFADAYAGHANKKGSLKRKRNT